MLSFTEFYKYLTFPVPKLKLFIDAHIEAGEIQNFDQKYMLLADLQPSEDKMRMQSTTEGKKEIENFYYEICNLHVDRHVSVLECTSSQLHIIDKKITSGEWPNVRVIICNLDDLTPLNNVILNDAVDIYFFIGQISNVVVRNFDKPKLIYHKVPGNTLGGKPIYLLYQPTNDAVPQKVDAAMNVLPGTTKTAIKIKNKFSINDLNRSLPKVVDAVSLYTNFMSDHTLHRNLNKSIIDGMLQKREVYPQLMSFPAKMNTGVYLDSPNTRAVTVISTYADNEMVIYAPETPKIYMFNGQIGNVDKNKTTILHVKDKQERLAEATFSSQGKKGDIVLLKGGVGAAATTATAPVKTEDNMIDEIEQTDDMTDLYTNLTFIFPETDYETATTYAGTEKKVYTIDSPFLKNTENNIYINTQQRFFLGLQTLTEQMFGTRLQGNKIAMAMVENYFNDKYKYVPPYGRYDNYLRVKYMFAMADWLEKSIENKKVNRVGGGTLDLTEAQQAQIKRFLEESKERVAFLSETKKKLIINKVLRSEIIRQNPKPVFPYFTEDYGIGLETKQEYAAILKYGEAKAKFREDKLQRYNIQDTPILIEGEEFVHIQIAPLNTTNVRCQISYCDFVYIELVGNHNNITPIVEVYGKVHTLINTGAHLVFDNVSDAKSDNIGGSLYSEMPNLPDTLDVKQTIEKINSLSSVRSIITENFAIVSERFLAMWSDVIRPLQILENKIFNNTKHIFNASNATADTNIIEETNNRITDINNHYSTTMKDIALILKEEIMVAMNELHRISLESQPLLAAPTETATSILLGGIDKINDIYPSIHEECLDILNYVEADVGKINQYLKENSLAITNDVYSEKRKEIFPDSYQVLAQTLSLVKETHNPIRNDIEELTIIKNLYAPYFSDEWHTAHILSFNRI